jgi:hypothetical protein
VKQDIVLKEFVFGQRKCLEDDMILNERTILAVASDFDGTIIKEGMTEPPTRFYEAQTQARGYGAAHAVIALCIRYRFS